MTEPAPLDRDAFAALLHTEAIGRCVDWHESIPSTMDLARQQASTGCPHGTLVFAEEQTAGRGRRGRSFYSPARRNLYFTLVLRLLLDQHRRLPIVLPVAVARAMKSEGAESRIKWPNDIWIGERKACGMLIDGEVDARGAIAFPGIGVNVNGDPTELAELEDIATSLSRELGREVAREPLLAAICNNLEQLLATPLASLVSEYRTLSCTLSREVEVIPSVGASYTGMAKAISDDGELMVERPDGLVIAVNAADVSLRPVRIR